MLTTIVIHTNSLCSLKDLRVASLRIRAEEDANVAQWNKLLSKTEASACTRIPQEQLLCVQVNYNLMAVNAFMAMTGLYQLSRKIRQDYGSQLGLAPAEDVKTV